MSAAPTKTTSDVAILGAGVAGLQALVALRRLAGPRVRITLVDADDTLRVATSRPELGPAAPMLHGLAGIAAQHGALFRRDVVTGIDPRARTASLASGAVLHWDLALVALGAVPFAPFDHTETLMPRSHRRVVDDLLSDLRRRRARSIAFVVPTSVSWSLPVYQLALTVRALADAERLPGVRLSIVTTESTPLAVFGPGPSAAVAEMLRANRIEVHADAYASVHAGGRVTIRPSRHGLRADRVVSLPKLEGLFLPGLPCDREGFVPVDRFGAVRSAEGVYAAGDAVAFPIKERGLAAQQGAAAAAAIAEAAGAPTAADPFHPLLRSVVRVGATEHVLQCAVTGGAGEGTISLRSRQRVRPKPKAPDHRSALHVADIPVGGRHGAAGLQPAGC